MTSALGRGPAVTGSDLTPRAQTTQGPDTRWTVSIPGATQVSLDASGRKGSLTVDLPLSAIRPPVTAELLKEVKGIRVMVPTPGFGAPFQFLTVNGEKVLRVDIHEADAEQLRKLPMTIGLSGEMNPASSTAVFRGILEVRLSSLAVDNSKPELALARGQRAEVEAQVVQEQQALAELRNGTSSWFATRNLQTRLEGAQQELQSAQSRLQTRRAQLESLLWNESPTSIVKAMPGPTNLTEEGWKVARALHRADQAVKQAQENHLLVVDVPEAAEESQAELDALTMDLGHAQGEWKTWLNTAQSLFQSWRAEEDSRADEWLSRLSFLAHPEFRESETVVLDLASSVNVEHERVQALERELQEAQEQAAAGLPEVIQESLKRIGALQDQRADLDRRIAGLDSGQIREISSFDLNYPVR